MKLLAAAAISMSVLAAQPARLPVLAELFTSEGCSSCPPADLLLMALDHDQPIPGVEIIVLSEHVDYWDSLGWKDPWSAPLYSQRQANYTRVLGAENYTPQMVIDGRVQVLGSDASAVRAAVLHQATRPKSTVHLTAIRDGAEAVIQLSIEPVAGAGVWLAIADPSTRSSVLRGENAHRTLDHVAVVRTLTKIASVKKSQPFEKTLRIPAPLTTSRIIVFLSDGNTPITGAAQTTLAAK